MVDDLLKKYYNDIEESSKCVSCTTCKGETEQEDVMWFHIPGKSDRRPFCSEDCKKAFIYNEMEYHKDMAAELKTIYEEM